MLALFPCHELSLQFSITLFPLFSFHLTFTILVGKFWGLSYLYRVPHFHLVTLEKRLKVARFLHVKGHSMNVNWIADLLVKCVNKLSLFYWEVLVRCASCVNGPFPNLPLASFSKRGLLLNHSYENEFNLHLTKNF